MTASEQEIRYALVDLEQERDVARDNDQPMLCRSLTVALTLARRGAQRMAADRGSTHWPGCWRVHGECAAHLLDEAIEVLRAADDTDSRALLARIDQTEVDDA